MNVKRGRITTTSWPNYVALAEVMLVLTLDKWTIKFDGGCEKCLARKSK